MVFRKPNFGPPPPGYIAGLGRGACGFITRGDIGPAKIGETTFNSGSKTMMAPPGLASMGGPPGLQAQNNNNQDAAAKRQAAQSQESHFAKQNEEDYTDQNFDDWNGYSGSLFAGIKEDAEDREADKSFAKVEDYIDGRRRQKREEKARELRLKYTQEHQDVSSKFSDAKRKLADISIDEWEALPDS